MAPLRLRCQSLFANSFIIGDEHLIIKSLEKFSGLSFPALHAALKPPPTIPMFLLCLRLNFSRFCWIQPFRMLSRAEWRPDSQNY
jgi:hypothetical protein